MKNYECIKTKKGTVWIANTDSLIINKRTDETKRNFERRIILLIIKECLGDCSLSYTKTGAPYIKNIKTELSITHSHPWYGVYFSENSPVGIDIQVMDRKLSPHTDYFINKEERSLPLNENNLFSIWGAKETLYKLYKGEVNNFKEEITVTKIRENTLELMFQGKQHTLEYYIKQNTCFVFSSKKCSRST